MDASNIWVCEKRAGKRVFPLRRNCQGCSHYQTLMKLWQQQEEELQTDFIKFYTLTVEEKAIAKKFCFPCAIQRNEKSSRQSLRLLTSFGN